MADLFVGLFIYCKLKGSLYDNRKVGEDPEIKAKKAKQKNKAIKGKVGMGIDDSDPTEKGMTKEEVAAYRAGKRRDGSDSEYRCVAVKHFLVTLLFYT